ncbi:MAG: AAA family ATPase [Acidimicrobiia bacterium]|nr:AAA family ATPase [Acidimicrobiia bacterium]
MRVIGAAHASIAAEQLGKAGIEARTIDSLRYALDTGRERLDRRTVLIVDEAEIAGNARLAHLVDACDRTGAKLVLVGDPAQLPAIHAGGMLRTLQRQFTTTISLDTNRRQRHEWERKAVDDLRNGRAQRALDAYAENDRIRYHPDAEARAAGVARAAIADWQERRSAVVLSGTNDNVDALNAAVQLGRWEAGQLGAELAFSKRDEPIHAGDRIMLLGNDTSLGVRNGQVATAIEMRDDTLVVQRLNGRRIALPREYVTEHTRLGYASTTHKAQGSTADVAHYAPDTMAAQEFGYVAATRGRAENVFHLIAADEPAQRAAARGAFEWQLRRSVAKTSAIDTGEPTDKVHRPVPHTTPRRPQPARHGPPRGPEHPAAPDQGVSPAAHAEAPEDPHNAALELYLQRRAENIAAEQAWASPGLTDTDAEATVVVSGRSPDASPAPAGVPSACGGVGLPPGEAHR